ncbi:MAG: hypothetical protein IT458_02985 [Planctomycetes bacterium]|nr:hypothetical protein [Planctomycetota bacterium]
MNSFFRFATPLLFAGLLAAQQTQPVRGKVEDVPGTNRFVLDCTNIPLQSSTLNLNTLVGAQWVLDVVNVGSATNPVLDVRAATAAQKLFDMGNLRIGRSDRWQVSAPAGSAAGVWLTGTPLTGYAPFGALGTWLLGPTFVLVNSGTTNQLGVFEFNFAPPALTNLVGQSFTAQAITMTNNQLTITNADCKALQVN